MSERLWFVRAGAGGAHVGEFLAGSHAAIGWNEVGAVTAATSDDELWKKFEAAYPEAKEGALRTSLGMVRRYTREVKAGDGVITYDPERRTYFLGTIESDVEMRGHPLGRVRRVSWTRQVSRDALSPMTRNPLGSTLTLFLVPSEARDEIAAKATPLSESAPETAPPPAMEPAVTQESELVLEDTLARAERLVEDRLEALTWQAMQELVAGILRAMGYRTRVSRAGSDRGIDIFASPDGLGLEEPRIFVEVKHRRGKMDAPQIRSFLGGRKPGDRCLYVSTGGFTKEAAYEADRASVPLQLVNLERLRELVLEYYEQLDPTVRALVPLRKVYWPE